MQSRRKLGYKLRSKERTATTCSCPSLSPFADMGPMRNSQFLSAKQKQVALHVPRFQVFTCSRLGTKGSNKNMKARIPQRALFHNLYFHPANLPFRPTLIAMYTEQLLAHSGVRRRSAVLRCLGVKNNAVTVVWTWRVCSFGKPNVAEG